MADKDLSNKPQNITPYLWYYEEPKGLNIVHDIHFSNGTYMRTDQIRIPWYKIKASVKRKLKGDGQ